MGPVDAPNGGATHVMNGDPSAPAIADIWAFGGPSLRRARLRLRSLVQKQQKYPRPRTSLRTKAVPVECVGRAARDLIKYLKLHYIPLGAPAWGAAADTLEDVDSRLRHLSAFAGHLGARDIQ